MCAEWSGEIKEDFDGTIKILMREAVTGIDAISVCPLMNTNMKGGAFPIMLQQLRRAV